MKNILEVTGLSVTSTLDGRKLISVQAYMPGNVELDPDDLAMLSDVLAEAASRFDGGTAAELEPEPEPVQPRRRRAAAEPEVAKEEPAADEAKPRRRRAAAEPEAPKEEPKDDEAPRRRRRTAEPDAPKGPTADDVAKAASKAAEDLGPKITAEIIGEFSTTGKLGDIPADKRQEFIDAINFELTGEE